MLETQTKAVAILSSSENPEEKHVFCLEMQNHEDLALWVNSKTIGAVTPLSFETVAVQMKTGLPVLVAFLGQKED